MRDFHAWLSHAVVCLTLLLNCQASYATDNPFGLPEPESVEKPGSVMLHGGGRGVRDYVREEFLRLAGGPNARIAFVPSDEEQWQKPPDKSTDLVESFKNYQDQLASPGKYGKWVKLCADNNAQFEFIHWKSPIDKDHEKFFSSLENATGVWIPAHDPEWVIQLFNADPLRPTRFQLALRNIVARGGVVGGLGGGMSSLCETMIAGDAEPTGFGWNTAKLRFGLGLLQQTIADQNFDRWTGRIERLTHALRNGPRLDRSEKIPGVERRTIGLGVDRDTVAIVTGATIRAIGEAKVDVLIKSNGDRTITWHRLKVGDDPITIRAASADESMAVRSSETTALKSPFGAPEPIQGGRFGTVVLHGGGETAEMYDFFPRQSRKANPHLVHCPSASESYRPMTQIELEKSDLVNYWKTSSVSKLSFINTNDPRQAENEDFVNVLRDADALWFKGGSQGQLSRLYVNPVHPTRFQQEVCQIVRRGGVVGGSSAGCAAMGDVMIGGTLNEEGEGPAVAELSRGLGVLSNVVAEQHFDAREQRLERFSHVLRNQAQLANLSPGSKPRQMIGIAVDENTGLVIRNDKVSVVGTRKAHIFLKSSVKDTLIWHTLEAGDVGRVVTGKDGSHDLYYEEWEIK